MSYNGTGPTPISYGDTTNIDAFGHLRVSQSNILLDSQFVTDSQPLLWDTSTSAGGLATHNNNQAAMILSVAAAPGSEVVRQTFRYWKYRAGHSHKIIMTVNVGGAVAGVTKEVGYNDASDGVFLRQTSTGTLQFVIRSSVSGVVQENAIDQANWNVDTLGAGALNPSGITLDISQAQIIWFDLQWLGAGRVRCGFNIGGLDVTCHSFLHANVIPTVYMSTGTLPCRYRIYNDTGANTASMRQVCTSVMWEGGSEGPGYVSSADTGTTTFNAGTTLTSLIAIRLKAANIRESVEVLQFEVINTGNEDIRAVLLFNPTVTGAFTWNPVGTNNSTEYSVSHLPVTADGFRMQTEYVLNSTGKKASVQATVVDTYQRIAASIAGVSDIVVLAVQTGTNNSAVLGSIAFKEVR